MLTYGKVFDKEIFIVEYEKDFHGNFITHFINQHKHFVQSTLKYFYADWKTADHDRNHVESTLFYNQSDELPESLLFGESFDVALNQDITIDTTYKEYGCQFNLLNPGYISLISSSISCTDAATATSSALSEALLLFRKFICRFVEYV